MGYYKRRKIYYPQQPRYQTRSKRYTAVEDVLNVNDNRLWYYIPSFRGYEISNDGYVRSMKNFKKFPFGILIKPATKGKNDDPIFELVTDSCIKVKIKRSQLLELARKNPYGVAGYPRTTCTTDRFSRNMGIFSKKPINVPPIDNTRSFPQFTVLDEPVKPKPIVPISSIDGSEYFGRKDLGTFLY